MQNKAENHITQRVLVVEDEFIIALDLERIVKNLGVNDVSRVSHIQQLRECIEIALQEQNGTPYYALILLDKEIKGHKNAFELIENLRVISKSIILTSSYNGECEDLAERLEGITAVPKPINNDLLSKHLADILE